MSEAISNPAEIDDTDLAEAMPAPLHAATGAIIGRPNVGKSTLFNRLVGKRQAIVHDQPGVTRDRITGSFALDSGLRVELIDTGGLVPGDDPLGLGDQVFLAIEESDLLLLVVDGREGLTTADEAVMTAVRRRVTVPIVVAVNKSDTRAAQEGFGEFYQLGPDDVILVSAEHALGIDDLHNVLTERLPERAVEAIDPLIPSLAIVGRPTVGKSSLLNRMVGHDRSLVSPQAGTTRDPIDSVLHANDRAYRLVDTAGIRRRSQVSGAAEDLAVLFARRQMERADLVLLVIDAARGLTSGDMAIAGSAWELGRAVVVVCNKWDLVDEELRLSLEDAWPRIDELLASPPRVNVSAHAGRRLDRLLPAVDHSLARYRTSLSTGEVNRLFSRAVARHQAPQKKGKPWKLYYATQVGTAPPTFMLFANRTLERSNTYRRYLENRIREDLELQGIPIRLVIRQRSQQGAR